MLNKVVKFTVIVAIVMVSLQSCTQPKLVRVPSALVDLTSAYEVSLQWQITSGKLDYSDSDGLFFANDDEHVYFANTNGIITSALIKEDGAWEDQVEWQRKYNEPIVSGPVLSEKGIIVGTSKASVMLLSPKDGHILWQTSLSSEVLSKAVVVDDEFVKGAVYVRTVDGQLYSLNVSTGKINWAVNRQLPKLSLRGIAPVTYDDGVIYLGWENGKVESIDAVTGQLKWSTQVVVPKGRTDLERLIDLQAELLIKNGRLYVFGYHGKLVAINPQNGNLFWAKEVSGYQDFIVDNQALYLVDEDDILMAYDLSNGTQIWKQVNFKYRELADLTFYGENQILLADGQGYFHWIDKLDGTQIARDSHVELENVGERIIRVHVANTRIFTLDIQGHVSVYNVLKK